MASYLADITDELLTAAFAKSWGPDTMRVQDQYKWDPANPSLDQCCITTLVANAIAGYTAYVCPMVDRDNKVVEDDVHYFNLRPDGNIYDGSADQFNHNGLKPVYEKKRKVQPEKLFRTKHVRDRFELLEPRVRKALEELSRPQI